MQVYWLQHRKGFLFKMSFFCHKQNILLILSYKFGLSLHYSGSNKLFVNATKLYQFKAKNSKIKDYALCLDVSKDFTTLFFTVDLNPIDTN